MSLHQTLADLPAVPATGGALASEQRGTLDLGEDRIVMPDLNRLADHSCVLDRVYDTQPVCTPLRYRAASYHGEFVEKGTLAEVAALGFNAIELQVEGDTMRGLEDLRRREDKLGFMKEAKALGLEIAIWTHEFSGLDPSVTGPISVSNPRVWQCLRDRYRFVCRDLLPETDYWVLTVVETEQNATEPDLLRKLVETINDEVSAAGKTLTGMRKGLTGSASGSTGLPAAAMRATAPSTACRRAPSGSPCRSPAENRSASRKDCAGMGRADSGSKPPPRWRGHCGTPARSTWKRCMRGRKMKRTKSCGTGKHGACGAGNTLIFRLS